MDRVSIPICEDVRFAGLKGERNRQGTFFARGAKHGWQGKALLEGVLHNLSSAAASKSRGGGGFTSSA